MMKNPLIDLGLLPNFSLIQPCHVKPAITSLMDDVRNSITKVLENIKDQEVTWDNFIVPLEEKMDKLSRAIGVVSHLNSVVSTDELRKEHDELLPVISEFYSWIGQHKGLYNAYKKLQNSENFVLLSEAQKKAIHEELIDFEHSGIALDDEKQKIYVELEQKISELSSKFSNNVLDATNNFYKHITDFNLIKDLPSSALELAKAEAKNKSLDGYVFTLKYPSYLPIMQYCSNRELRYEMYYAYVTRASELGPNACEFDNSDIIKEEVTLLSKQANLLGFSNYAELSLSRKMAESSKQVDDFLDELVSKSKHQAELEYKEVCEYAKKIGFNDELQPWDISYYSEKLKQDKYSITDEEIRVYFPLPKVLNGLFSLAKILFKIDIRPHLGVDVWHKDVCFYDIYNNNNELIAGFYTDLYARDKKNGGAWMNDCSNRRYKQNGSLQIPIAYVIANFIPSIGDKPALLNHDEVETLFHEFGHALHHMLTEIDISSVAGINRVPWDAVELPSQFMENFTWNPEVLSLISSHVETNDPLPSELLNKMLESKNYHSALAMLRQIEFAAFDMYMFDGRDVNLSAQEKLNKIREKVSVLPATKFNRFQNTFTHIFSGGYSAGYYSYKWAELLSADVFSKFEEFGVLNPTIGKKYLDCILKNGGSKDFMSMFIDFMGRKPSIDALLKYSGIKF